MVLSTRRQDGPVNATDTKQQRPVVVILGANSDEPPPGLEPIMESASFRFAADAQELEGAIGGANVLFVWDFRSTELRDAWHRVDKLQWVHVAGAGVDAVLFPDMVESRVTLTNSRGVFDRSIAEYVLGLMLVFAKELHQTLGLQQQKKWVHRETEMLAGRKLLVVGAGSIGRTIARLARCAGMEVDAIARTARSSDEDFGRVFASEDLNDALPSVDYVVVAAPLTAQTRGMFGAAQFERMKPSARLINVGRGPIVDEPALIEALRDGRIVGAALDVFSEEPLPEDSPLWEMPQVVVSPHMSGDFVGWLEALGELFVENFRRWERGDELLNVVDKERGYASSG
jgi:phosphoglycerate dehydrogenase-like enzyme